MDALLRKVKKPPSSAVETGSVVVRHEKLAEGWAENSQPVAEDDGVVFYLKYLGFTLVDEVDGDESYADGPSTRAVQRIVAMAKSEGKKLQKVALRVSCKGIQMVDIMSKESLADISIYRISFCTADKTHDKVFAFIARNTINETMVCHAFLCAKPKIAQAVTLTVWQSFNVAEEKWALQQQQKKVGHKYRTDARSSHTHTQQQQQRCSPMSAPIISWSSSSPVKVDQPVSASPPSCPFNDSFADYNIAEISVGNVSRQSRINKLTFNDDSDDSLEDSFSKLAEVRGRGCVPSFSTDLKREDLDSVQQYMDGHRCFEEFSLTKSLEDLLNL